MDTLSLDEILRIKAELQAKYGPPLKAVKMSRATAATFPSVPTQSTVETLYGVPIEWDESLSVGEYVPVYAKCGARFFAERNGWRCSLLCELPVGHEGTHGDTATDILIEQVLEGMGAFLLTSY